MINKKEFGKIRKEVEDSDRKREELIQISRKIIKLSKQIIYSLHRNDLKNALNKIKLIKKEKNNLEKIPKRRFDTNIGSVAMQEYVEALCYYEFVRNNKIPTKSSLKVNSEDYLMGLCDLTGELVRKAVASVINKKFKDALKIKELVNEIYGEFLKFDLRNSELRKKSDSIKWNLKKLEDIIFDITLKGKLK